MSRIEQLVEELCPNGVSFKALGEIGSFYGGLTGKTKSDFQDGNSKYVTYMNVFSNIALNTDIVDTVKVENGEKQNCVEVGDILFTGSSETPDECGMSSVLTRQANEKLYLNSFCFGFRLKDKNLFLPDFSKYLFRSRSLRKQIEKTASGVTRFNVSKQKMLNVRVPIPPLSVQKEIVRILDSFTELEAELKAELEARKRQYEYYRDKLLALDKPTGCKRIDRLIEELCINGVPMYPLRELSHYSKSRISCKDIDVSTYVGVENLLQNKRGKVDATSLPSAGNVIKYEDGDVLIGNIRPYLRKIWLADSCGGTNGDVLVIQIEDRQLLSPKFLYYVLSSENFFLFDIQHSKGAKMPRGSKEAVMTYTIPVPPMSVQEEIVHILDRFDSLSNNISEGLPAEIEARRKQYEYYRDKLLTFKELEA